MDALDDPRALASPLTDDAPPEEVDAGAFPPEEEGCDEEPQLPSFFIHREEVVGIIVDSIARLKTLSEEASISGKLAYPGAVMVESMGADPAGVQAALFKMEHLLSFYQEAPTLLLPHLEELMGPLLDAILYMMPRSIDKQRLEADVEERLNTAKITAEADGLITSSSPNTTLLGRDYLEYDSDSPKTALHNLCRALYFVVKVAGPKACTSHLPHDVKLLEDVFYCLRHWQVGDPSLKREWEVRYCFLLWLSSLVLVPFSFQTIDSSLGGSVPLSQQLLECAWEFLSEPSRCREAAASLIARLNTRPDSLQHRQLFFQRALEAVESGDAVLKNGVLLAIATTHKLGKREELVGYSPALIPIVGEITHTSKDVKTAKTAVKVLQRLGLSLLKKRSASWRYRQTVVSLEANLARAMGAEDGKTSGTTMEEEEERGEEDEGIPDAIEDVIGYLLTALSHSDTIVRWSAAKGIGRLCGRLPKEMAQDIVMAVVEVFELYENDCGWHGGLLALAELCRGSILLPESFEKAMPLVAKGLHYELSRGSFSVGSHVRDAACYVCWSVARAYNPSDLERYAHSLSTSLISTALFDREVNVRRAAAAAFQECVGRLGNFPNGIDLVTTMDFFSLATTRNAYLSVAPQVAKYDAYRPSLMEHLFKTKLVHWDKAIRRYAADALAAISETDSSRVAINEYFPSLVSQAKETTEVAIRHGSILAVAAMVRSLKDIPQGHIDDAVNIIPALDSKRHFRGRGVEYVRQACCSLVLGLATSKRVLPEHVEILKLTGQKGKAATKGNLQRFLEDSWKQPLEWLQWEAVEAFGAFSREFYHPYSEAFHGKVFAGMVAGTPEGKAPNERRGCTAAIGAIPLSIALAPLPAALSTSPAAAAPAAPAEGDASTGSNHRLIYEEALSVLRSLTVLSANKDEQDAETRRNAVRAMTALLTTLGANTKQSELVECGKSIASNSFTDYAVDKRGDVGSYARTEALKATPGMLMAMMDAGLITVQAPEELRRLVLTYVQCALKQAVEKIDRVRLIAGTALKALLTDAAHGPSALAILTSISDVPSSDVDALAEVMRTNVVDWAAPQETFPLLVSKLITTRTFGPFLMEGMPASVGGLSLHVLRSAQEALFTAFAHDNNKGPLTRLLVQTAAKYSHNERVVVPICVTMERLIEKGLFETEYLGDVVDMLVSETRFFSTDINRLLSFVPLLGALCQCSVPSVRKAAWHHALILVASRYPKVRARVATDLYTAVLMVSARGDINERSDEGVEGIGKAMEILTVTQWDDTDVTLIKGARDSLYSLLGLKAEDRAQGYAQGALSMCAEDALRSNRSVKMGTYTSLVREMGY